MYCKNFLTTALLAAAATATMHEVAPPVHEPAPVAPVVHEPPKPQVHAPMPVEHEQPVAPVHVAPPKHEKPAPVAPAIPPKHEAAPWADVKGKGHEQLTVYLVAVGDNNGSLKYFPDTVHAAPGSIVQFQFHPKNHTVTESTFDEPCKAKDPSLATAQRPGLKSGFVPVTPADTQTPVFNVLVNDTEPIWVFCGQGPHCQSGMSMVINPPANPERTIMKYQEAAALLPKPESPASAPPAGAPPIGGPPESTPSGVSPPASSPESESPAASSPDSIPAEGANSSDESAPATFTGAATKPGASLMGIGALAVGLVALL